MAPHDRAAHLLLVAAAQHGSHMAVVPQVAGNLEGKEVRFGVANSALFATVTTDTSCGAINFTECPNDCRSRAQWWLAPQASIAITVGASFSRNANISLRRSFFRRTGSSAALTP